MNENDKIISDFMIEADEIFSEAESSLLEIEKNIDFEANFNSVYRAFHSLKGAAGMFELEILQDHMHKMEGIFEKLKERRSMESAQVDFFLLGVDAARRILGGEKVDFVFPHDIEAIEGIEREIEKKIDIEVIQEKIINRRFAKDKVTIAVVDDEALILDLIRQSLSEYGYDVHTFKSGEDFLKKINKNIFDLILLDLNMDGLSGLEILKKMRESLIETPVVFVSGYLDKKTIIESLEFGIDGFVEKPFSDSKIITVCKLVIEKNQTQKILERAINYMMYQFGDLDDYLKSEKKEIVRQTLRDDLRKILDLRNELKERKKYG